jgi:competence protein ComEC
MVRPFFPLAAALACGILAGSYLYFSPGLAVSLIAGALVAALVCSLAGARDFVLYLLLAAVFLLGALHIGAVMNPEVPPDHISRLAGREVYMEGVVAEDPRLSEDRAELVIDSARVFAGTTAIPASGKVLVRVMDWEDCPLPQYGDLIRFQMKLKAPRSFRNPGGFEYERWLLFKGIRVRGIVKSAAGIAVIRENQGNSLRHHLERFRARLRAIVGANAPMPEASIIQAMVLGEQNGIPRDLYDRFSRTGTSHIIAISGFNISIIALCVFFVFKSVMGQSEWFLLRFNATKAAALCSVFPIIAFAFIAGLGISTVRATVMVLIFLAGLLIDRERDLPNTLACAAFAVLAFSPVSLFDVSFQLSFAAVAAILYFAPRLNALLPEPDLGARLMKKAARAFLIFLIVTLSATAGTLPLILFYFNILSLSVVPANLVLLPVLGYVVLFLSMAVIAASVFSAWLAGLFVQAGAFFVNISIRAVEFIEALPYSYIHVPTPTLPEIAAFYIFAFAAAGLLPAGKRRRDPDAGPASLPEPAPEPAPGATPELSIDKNIYLKAALVATAVFLVFDGLFHYGWQRNPGALQAACLDAGQASSTFIRFPGGKTMLVDGGGFFDSEFDVGRFVVAPFLWQERVTGLDFVVLTHPHPDHLNGLIFILRNFRVGEVWTNGRPPDSGDTEPYDEFLKIIRDRKIPHRLISERTPDMDIGGVRISFLNPPRNVSGDSNNDAIAMRLAFGKTGLLMPADIMHETEQRLASGRQRNRLGSDILIAPHHGAGSSSSALFLKAVSPEAAVFSCGGNPHVPSAEVLARYEKMKIKTYRTDRDGAVTIRSDGEEIQVRIEEARRGRF